MTPNPRIFGAASALAVFAVLAACGSGGAAVVGSSESDPTIASEPVSTTASEPDSVDEPVLDAREPTDVECPFEASTEIDYDETAGYASVEEAFEAARAQEVGNQPGEWVTTSLTDTRAVRMLITNQYFEHGPGIIIGEMRVSREESGWLVGFVSICVKG